MACDSQTRVHEFKYARQFLDKGSIHLFGEIKNDYNHHNMMINDNLLLLVWGGDASLPNIPQRMTMRNTNAVVSNETDTRN